MPLSVRRFLFVVGALFALAKVAGDGVHAGETQGNVLLVGVTGSEENLTITAWVVGLIQMCCPLTPTAKKDPWSSMVTYH